VRWAAIESGGGADLQHSPSWLYRELFEHGGDQFRAGRGRQGCAVRGAADDDRMAAVGFVQTGGGQEQVSRGGFTMSAAPRSGRHPCPDADQIEVRSLLDRAAEKLAPGSCRRRRRYG